MEKYKSILLTFWDNKSFESQMIILKDVDASDFLREKQVYLKDRESNQIRHVLQKVQVAD